MKKVITESLRKALLENTDNEPDLIEEFIIMCCVDLGIRGKVKVHLENTKENIETTAAFNIETNDIYIYVKGRHIVDIIRSIGHELEHLSQKLNGELKPNSGEDGSPEENDANTFSGIMVRKFGKKYPEIYE